MDRPKGFLDMESAASHDAFDGAFPGSGDGCEACCHGTVTMRNFQLFKKQCVKSAFLNRFSSLRHHDPLFFLQGGSLGRLLDGTKSADHSAACFKGPQRLES